jgi:uncharacterized membrane protein
MDQGDETMKSIVVFIATMIVFFVMDMIWLGFIAKNLYAEQIGTLLKRSGDELTPNWFGAMFVYIALTLGVMIFVLPKADKSLAMAAVWGVVFGLISYAIYDFTNYAVLANWPLKITLIDLMWGGFLCGVTSYIAALIQSKLF